MLLAKKGVKLNSAAFRTVFLTAPDVPGQGECNADED
jgi:hypothetical protein